MGLFQLFGEHRESESQSVPTGINNRLQKVNHLLHDEESLKFDQDEINE